MPLYDFECNKCGVYEMRAHYEDDIVPCECGSTASRLSVYKINHKIEGQSLPRRDDHDGTREEMGKELKKRGYSFQRAIDEIGSNIRQSETSNLKELNTPALTKEI